MQRPHNINTNFNGRESRSESSCSDPKAPKDEEQPFPVDISQLSAKEEECCRGQGIGGDDPLLSSLGNIEVSAYGWEDDDYGLSRDGLRWLEEGLGKLGENSH